MKARKPWLITLVVLGALIFGPGIYHVARLSWQERVQARALQRLEAMYEGLLEERTRLQQDPVYVEGLVRSTLKLAKPGELVVTSEAVD